MIDGIRSPILKSKIKNQKSKIRLDLALVDRGLIPTREKAQRSIMSGQIRVNDQPVLKGSYMVSEDDSITCAVLDRYVSRGGVKLEAALDHFKICPNGCVALDVGASTGGFTDCLLQRGAKEVVALDVGHGQLHWKIRQDERVEVRERVNARNLNPGDFSHSFEIIVCDVSFISLRLIIPALTKLLAKRGWCCLLIKPQFEAGKREVGKGGIVRNEVVRTKVVSDLQEWVRQYPLLDHGVIPSPITGTDGNHEFLWGLTLSE